MATKQSRGTYGARRSPGLLRFARNDVTIRRGPTALYRPRRRDKRVIAATEAGLVRQHLIDPEICIRCNTCESTCPVGAISHDARNYVVDANICNLCMACVPPCPTGSIDNWRAMPRTQAYSVEAQFGWDVLPAELSADELVLGGAALADAPATPPVSSEAPGQAAFDVGAYAAVTPPWSAERAIANLYG